MNVEWFIKDDITWYIYLFKKKTFFNTHQHPPEYKIDRETKISHTPHTDTHISSKSVVHQK